MFSYGVLRKCFDTILEIKITVLYHYSNEICVSKLLHFLNRMNIILMNESTISKYGLENIQLPDIWKSKHLNRLRSPIQMSKTQESIPSNQSLDLESVISLSHPFHCYSSLILGVD